MFVQHHESDRETAVLSLDRVQMGIKPRLASVSLLLGLSGKQTEGSE